MKNSMNNINNTTANNTTTIRNERVYTFSNDIENELTRWGELGKFAGKNIVCPCEARLVDRRDGFRIQIFFDGENIESLEVNYVHENGFETEELAGEEAECFIYKNVLSGYVNVLCKNAGKWGISSITAYDCYPEIITEKRVWYETFDICIGTPQFHLYKDFIDQVIGKIDFIALVPYEDRWSNYLERHLQDGDVYLGFNRSVCMEYFDMAKDFEHLICHHSFDWVTSWDDAQKQVCEDAKNVDYVETREDYIVCENMTMKDGTHPIKVPANQIPSDYDGWMFTGIDVLDKIDTDTYELYPTNLSKYFNVERPELNPFAHKVTNNMMIHNGKRLFHGFVIRKKH